jgi:hypothetical protein
MSGLIKDEAHRLAADISKLAGATIALKAAYGTLPAASRRRGRSRNWTPALS